MFWFSLNYTTRECKGHWTVKPIESTIHIYPSWPLGIEPANSTYSHVTRLWWLWFTTFTSCLCSVNSFNVLAIDISYLFSSATFNRALKRKCYIQLCVVMCFFLVLSSSCVRARCCQCLWILHSWLSIRFSLTFIYRHHNCHVLSK